jgi:two-component system response regulator AtoC
MPVGLQTKLLHVLQDRAFTKLGSNRPVEVDVRVLAATNRDLAALIRTGHFREDLYYRLQVIEIRVPALRYRREEIPMLVEFFLRRYAERYGRPLLMASPQLMRALTAYSWPGNIRELENMMKRYVILRDEPMLIAELERERPADLVMAEELTAPVRAAGPAVAAPTAPAPPATVEVASSNASSVLRGSKLPELARAAALSAEREAIQSALDHFRWNRRKAAAQLGVSYKTLLNKMKECGITDPPRDELEG